MKYITDVIDYLTDLKNGMVMNLPQWANEPVTPEMLQTRIDAMEAKKKEVEDAKKHVNILLGEAHQLSIDNEAFGETVETRATLICGDNAALLGTYGIKPRKQFTRKPVPTKVLIPILADDTDGEGFILTTQVDPDADSYEWQKGIGADASNIQLIPEMVLFKVTKKICFVDDDVQKGKRIFYRVRAINAAGQGPWSEAVSRVQ